MKKSTWIAVTAVAFVLIAVGAYPIIKKYEDYEDRKNEVLLMQNLRTMRRAIEFYQEDKKRPPETLLGLVTEGYLREIPDDPITKSNQTWVVDREKGATTPSGSSSVVGIHSGARGADRSGKPYNSY